MPLRLSGELAFTVDGPEGSTSGRAYADGSVLHVHTEDTVVAWDAATGAAPSATGALGTLADQLAADGLSVRITGPRGRLATVGAGADSLVGRAVTGSRHVAPGAPAALRPLVVAALRQGVRRRPSLLLALAAVAVVAARRRRQRP